MAGEPIEFDYEIAVVGGEHGKRLAAQQASAILGVLDWFSRPQQQAGTLVEPSNEEDLVTDDRS